MTCVKIIYGHVIDTPKFDDFLRKIGFIENKLRFFEEYGFENIQIMLGTNVEVFAPVCVFTNVRQNKILQDYTPYSRIYLGVALFDFEIYNVNHYHTADNLKYISRYRDAINKILQLSSFLADIVLDEPVIHCVYNKYSIV